MTSTLSLTLSLSLSLSLCVSLSLLFSLPISHENYLSVYLRTSSGSCSLPLSLFSALSCYAVKLYIERRLPLFLFIFFFFSRKHFPLMWCNKFQFICTKSSQYTQTTHGLYFQFKANFFFFVFSFGLKWNHK